MTSRRRPRAKSWALRLFVALSYALLASMSWQLALVEVVEHHETASQQDCPDDDDEGSCDCGPNCHCCLSCSHQAPPVLPVLAGELVPLALAPIDLAAFEPASGVISVDRGPPSKVPKLVA